MKTVMTALVIAMAASPSLAADKIFNGPKYRNVLFDSCAGKAGPCGQAVAAQFCKANGFKFVKKFSVSEATAKTVYLGSFKPCDRRECHPFDRIHCTDSLTVTSESSTDIGEVKP